MKILYIGGQKSGKSKLAEKCILKLAKKNKPYYIATYNNSFGDKSMIIRINNHKKMRKNNFITIEKTVKLHKYLKPNNYYIIDCLSMWLLNHIKLSNKQIIKELKKMLKIKTNIVFVLNDVNHGVIPMDKISRKFVDMSGIIGQLIAKNSKKVIRVDYGLQTKLK